MLLKTLKSNNIRNLFFVPIAIVAFWIGEIMVPFQYNFAPGEKESVFFSPVFQLVGSNLLVSVILSAVLVLALAFLMQMVNARYQFIRIRTKLPSILFVVTIGGFVDMHTLHPVYFGAIFLVLALFRLFALFEQGRSYSLVFDAGMLLGVGVLFYFNMVVSLPAFLIGIYVLSHEIKWREFLILLLGFILPLLFVTSYFYYVDRFPQLWNMIEQYFTVNIGHLKENLSLQIYLGVLIVLTLLGSFSLAQQYDYKKVSSRKYFSVLFLIFVFSMISFAFIPATSQEMLVITAIPVTFLVSNFFVFMKSRFWSEFFFIALLLGVVLMQFFE